MNRAIVLFLLLLLVALMPGQLFGPNEDSANESPNDPAKGKPIMTTDNGADGGAKSGSVAANPDKKTAAKSEKDELTKSGQPDYQPGKGGNDPQKASAASMGSVIMLAGICLIVGLLVIFVLLSKLDKNIIERIESIENNVRELKKYLSQIGGEKPRPNIVVDQAPVLPVDLLQPVTEKFELLRSEITAMDSKCASGTSIISEKLDGIEHRLDELKDQMPDISVSTQPIPPVDIRSDQPRNDPVPVVRVSPLQPMTLEKGMRELTQRFEVRDEKRYFQETIEIPEGTLHAIAPLVNVPTANGFGDADMGKLYKSEYFDVFHQDGGRPGLISKVERPAIILYRTNGSPEMRQKGRYGIWKG